MDASERAKTTNFGMTLIEVLVGLMIFSAMIGLASNLIDQGLKAPFISDRVEKWLQLLEDTNIIIKNLPHTEDLSQFSTDMPPLNRVVLPMDLDSWRIDWHECTPDNAKMALFSAKTVHGKKFQWRVYKKSP